jgi:hypothetical protein
MNKNIGQLQSPIEPFRNQVINHRVYSAITSLEDLSIFMEYHIFAVWDFMSLLKQLQSSLTCTSAPWFPIGSGKTRYLINEIVAGEESDVDISGNRKSHYELYIDAMQQCGADTSKIESFLAHLKAGKSLADSLYTAKTPDAAANFVQSTFDVIESGKTHAQAAAFTFGREDLIPGMFITLVGDIHKKFPQSISIFKYYLERHIEVDGDHHSHLALEMTSSLCGDDNILWQEAEKYTIEALQQRLLLWDGAYEAIMARRN